MSVATKRFLVSTAVLSVLYAGLVVITVVTGRLWLALGWFIGTLATGFVCGLWIGHGTDR